jgi:hypothetical protein
MTTRAARLIERFAGLQLRGGPFRAAIPYGLHRGSQRGCDEDRDKKEDANQNLHL